MDKKLRSIVQFSRHIVLSAMLLIPLIPGCSKESTEGVPFVASINKEQIRLDDFQREMALRSKQNPSYKVTRSSIDEQLNTIIDRKLMIQEAMKLGLARKKDFVRTIQTFWEQTLIRELIDEKNREWEDRLFVTGHEISDYYEKMRYSMTIKVIMAGNKAEADSILDKARKGEVLQWDTLGPVTYHDVVSGNLKKAFDMPEGQSGIVEDEKGFMVVNIEKKDVLDLPPLDSLQDRIKQTLLQQKKTDALEVWLRDVRDKAVIEVDHALLDASYQIESVSMQENHAGQAGDRDVR